MFTLLRGGSADRCQISGTLLADMDFSFLIPAKDYPVISDYLTYNEDDIKARQALFGYLSDNPDMISFFDRLSQNVEYMIDCAYTAKAVSDSEDNESLYYSFREFGFFTDSIEDICKTLAGTDVPQLASLYEKAKEIKEQTWYENAKLFTENIDKNLREIKSVAVGINLNAQLMPLETGIIAIESEPYVTNSLYDKMFAPRIKDKKMLCIAPLGINDAKLDGVQMRALNINLYRAINSVMKGSLKKIRGILEAQFRQASGFLLGLDGELRFINTCASYILEMKAKALPLCFPDTNTDISVIKDLYNPNLLRYMKTENIIKNDVCFDDTGKIHLVVGVNSGGKSVFLRSVGIAQIMFQLGLPVPARKAGMIPFRGILSCFSGKVEDIKGGHLENECKLMSSICEEATDKSLILLDEIYSSTNSYDAALLAMKTVRWFALKGCCSVYTTHIHELITKTGEINGTADIKSRVDILCADYQNEKATFRIVRKDYNYESTAVQIFKKYGMDFLL